MGRVLWCLVLVVAGVLVAPVPAAGADTAELAGATVSAPLDGNMRYTGRFGFANNVVVTASGGTVEVDDVHPLAISGDCWYPDAADHTRAVCTAMFDLTVEPGEGDDVVTIAGDTQNWRLDLGPGADRADVTGANPESGYVVQLNGGTGDDVVLTRSTPLDLDGQGGTDTVSYATPPAPFLKCDGSADGVTVDLGAGVGGPTGDDAYESAENAVGGCMRDTLTGDAGANRLEGGAGDDVLDGAGGNDTVVGGTGTDELHGGAGTDTASYAGHTQAVTADLDGVADDGAPGEDDLVAADVENLSGGTGADTLSGDGGANRLTGDACLGVVLCAGQGDVLDGGAGVDELVGGFGDDTLSGGSGNDTLSAGPGNDTLYGDGGFDALDGGSGTDSCSVGLGGGTTTNCE
ncbi:calcium-binding protein [Dactylosporangium sp. NPDC005572]|uniref:calcium-binding protein n=1 Tax=Dactylosporangium sp. NPDC005572 TaxID=3156889 RepID=UPI0033AF4042